MGEGNANMMKCVQMKVGQSKKNKWEYMMVNNVSQIAYLGNITIDRMAMGMTKNGCTCLLSNS